MPQQDAQLQLLKLITAYWSAQAVTVAAELGLADQLAAGPLSTEQLAQRVGAEPQALYRLLRALASLGIFSEGDGGRFALTPQAELLREDHPSHMRAVAIMMGGEHFKSWGALRYSIETGHCAFEHVYGKNVFDYLAEHLDKARIFDAAMSGIHGRETAAMLDAYDFTQFGTLADIGGGNGSLLAAILQRCPSLRGLLYDLPHVVERAQAELAQAGMSDRVQAIGGSFFESVPSGADAYMLRHIIHDWTDEQSIAILRNCRQVLPPHGKLLLVEMVIPPGNDASFAKLLDLNMLVMPGGQERTADEYARLFAAADLRLQRVVPTSTEISVVEAVPV